MNNEKYINNITLEILLNPILYDRINNSNYNSNELISQNILFYKRRICKITKDMCKGEFINDNFKKLFINYATTIVYYLKHLDEKDILQSDYIDLNMLDNSYTNINNNNIIDNSNIINANIDNIIMNKLKTTIDLDKFVKRINIQPVEKILPKQRIVNINDPVLKNKGIKEKSNNSINETSKKKNRKIENT